MTTDSDNKLSIAATVIGIRPDPVVSGIYSVDMSMRGERGAFRLSLEGVTTAKIFGSVFGEHEAVRITFETGEGDCGTCGDRHPGQPCAAVSEYAAPDTAELLQAHKTLDDYGVDYRAAEFSVSGRLHMLFQDAHAALDGFSVDRLDGAGNEYRLVPRILRALILASRGEVTPPTPVASIPLPLTELCDLKVGAIFRHPDGSFHIKTNNVDRRGIDTVRIGDGNLSSAQSPMMVQEWPLTAIASPDMSPAAALLRALDAFKGPLSRGAEHLDAADLGRTANELRGLWGCVEGALAAATAQNEAPTVASAWEKGWYAATSACARVCTMAPRVDGPADMRQAIHAAIMNLGLAPVPPTPPLVNGRPSCCEAAAETAHLIEVNNEWGRWAVGDERAFRECSFCPFCGSKLPPVQP